MADGDYLKNLGPKNLDGLLDDFRQHLRATDRSASEPTYVGAVRVFAEWIAGRYGDFDPSAVSPLDLVEYRDHLQTQKSRRGKPMAPATVNKVLISLRMFFEWLRESGQIRDNPVAGVKQVALAAEPAPKWLSRKDQAALIHVVRKNPRDVAIIGIMLYAGLRVSEVCALAREDIQISERKGVVRVRRGKGGKYRVVPLNKTIRRILADWLDLNPEGPLFPNRYGRPISVDGVEKLFAEYVRRAKLEGITPHCLRHAFCKNLVGLGVPLDQVAMLAGHASLDVTKRYTAPSLQDLQDAVERAAWE